MRSKIACCVSICLILLVLMPIQAASNPVPVRPESFGDPIPAQNTSIRFISESINVTFLETAYVTAQYDFKNSEDKDVIQAICLPFARSDTNLSLTIGDQHLRYSWGIFRYDYRTFRACKFELVFAPFEEKNLTAAFKVDCENWVFNNWTSNESGAGYEFKYLATTGRAWGRPIERATFAFNIRKDACDIEQSLASWSGYDVAANGSWVTVRRDEADWIPDGDIIFDWVVHWKHKPVACLDYIASKVNRNDTFYFDLSASYDQDGQVVLYYVDFGDGKNSGWGRSSLLPHSYRSPGLYFPVAQVRDNTSLDSEVLRAGPISVETGQDTILDKNGYVLLEIASGLRAKEYTLSPAEQILDGCCDFDVNGNLRMVIARNSADCRLEGVFSTPHSSSDIDILDISDNGSVLLSLKGSFGTARMRLGYLESWPCWNLTSKYDATRITNWGIWSKSRFRHLNPPASIPDPRNPYGYDTALLQTQEGLYRLVWDGDKGLYYSESSDARSWSEPSWLPVAPTTYGSWEFCMIEDRNGTSWLVWSDALNSTNNDDLWISFTHDFINWTPAKHLPNDIINSGFDEHDPFLMQDAEGIYWLAFVSERLEPGGLYLSRSLDCENWTVPSFICGGYGNYFPDWITNPSLFQDNNKVFWYIWDAKNVNKPYDRIIFYETSPDGLV